MNNEEPKKKILSLVRGAMLEADELPFIEATEHITDVLIAAGIGDVKVVERALQKFAKYILCEECPFFSDCVSPEKMEYPIHSNNCFAEYLRQTEKELAEERKE